MQGSKTRYGRGEPSGAAMGTTARPPTFSQFSSSGSLETATMLPASVPWYMAMTRSSSTKVAPEKHLSSGPG